MQGCMGMHTLACMTYEDRNLTLSRPGTACRPPSPTLWKWMTSQLQRARVGCWRHGGGWQRVWDVGGYSVSLWWWRIAVETSCAALCVLRKIGGWCWFCLRDTWVLLQIAAAWAGIAGKWQVLWVWEGHEEWQEGCGHVSRRRGGRWRLTEAAGVSEGKESWISAEIDER